MTKLAAAWTAEPSYVQRQLLFAVVFTVTVFGIPVTGLNPSSWSALISAVVVLVVTTALTVVLPWPSWRREWRLFIPLGSMIAVGLLRAATGEAASPYGFLIMLPALAVGAGARRRWPVLLAAVGADLMVFLPYLVLTNPAPMSAELSLRALFIPFIATVAALAVNELTRDVRARMASMRDLQQEQEKLLLRTQRDAEELAGSAQQLRAARDDIASVIAAVTEQSIIATDPDGLITVFNPGAEKMLGVQRSDAERTRHVVDFHLPAELAAVGGDGRSGFDALVTAAETGQADVRDWTYLRPDGREVITQLATTARYDRRGAAIGYLFVATDMTAAREVARLKDEFVSLISHELRTPLSSILGYLELVLDDEDTPLSPEQTQYLTIVERNAQRLLRLVGDLLFAAQVEAGKFAIDEQDVDLAAVVAAAAETALPTASTAGVRVETNLPTETVVVCGDPVRLGQACDNLLSNAIKFTPRDGEVCVSLERSGHCALISVRDTGFGIAKAEVESLFARFFRASTATQHAISGVGLGLSITRAIVLAHHGELDVQSVEGSGTTFRMRIPLRQT